MTDSTTRLAKLAEIGLNSMREMRRMRKDNESTVAAPPAAKISAKRVLLESRKAILEDTVSEEELEVIEENSNVDENNELEEAIESAEASEAAEEDEGNVEDIEEGTKQNEPIVVGEVGDSLLEAITAAYNSNEDFYPDPDTIDERCRAMWEELNTYDIENKLLLAAVLVAHLSANTFVGAHSYTFRKEVVVDGVWAIDKLLEADYIWPEVYNNSLMTEEMKAAYEQLDKEEVSRVMDVLRVGGSLSAQPGMICYTTPSDACSGLRACKITAKQEIIVPGMQDGKPIGYCFKREVLFDALLTQKIPSNPRTGEAFPQNLVQSIYNKYKGELLMRTYYLESIGETLAPQSTQVTPTAPSMPEEGEKEEQTQPEDEAITALKADEASIAEAAAAATAEDESLMRAVAEADAAEQAEIADAQRRAAEEDAEIAAEEESARGTAEESIPGAPSNEEVSEEEAPEEEIVAPEEENEIVEEEENAADEDLGI